MRARRAPDDLKGLFGLQAVSLGHDSLGLLDRDAGLERVLELCAPLIGRLGDREEPADRRGCFVARTVAESLDRLHLGPILQGDDLSRDSRPGEFERYTEAQTEGDLALLMDISPGRSSFGYQRGNDVHESKKNDSVVPAQNQLLFRSVNEQIVGMTENFRSDLSDINLVCECWTPSCTGTIRCRLEEFELLDRTGNMFIVLAGP